MDGVNTPELKKLILRRVPDVKALEKKLTLVSNASFEWAMTSREWEKAAGLVDGLLENNKPGNQYLTQEGVDDALVELAFME